MSINQKNDPRSTLEQLAQETPVHQSRYIELSVDIAGLIQDYIVREGISQKVFAERMGRQPSEISKWTSGFHNFTLKTLALLEEQMGERLIASQTEIDEEAVGFNAKFSLPVSGENSGGLQISPAVTHKEEPLAA